MVFFKEIVPTEHYVEYHAKDVPWKKVVEIVFTTKNPRKKGAKFEIEKDGYYLLFKIEKGVLSVINAKKQ